MGGGGLYLHRYLLARLASRLVTWDSNENTLSTEMGHAVRVVELAFSKKRGTGTGRMSPLLWGLDLYAGPSAIGAAAHED